MASIYDGPGSLLHVWSTDFERGPHYLAGGCAEVITRVAQHALRDHECDAFSQFLSADSSMRASTHPDLTGEDRAEELRQALERALDCVDAIRAERACFERIIDTARVALAALDEAERDADRMASDARAALVTTEAAQ